MIGRTYLADFGTGAAQPPITNRGTMRRLAEILRVERRWLFELCGMQVSSPTPRKVVVVGEAQKPPARSASPPKPPAAPTPAKIKCDTCHIVKSVSEYHRTNPTTCMACIAEAKDARRNARRAERRKEAREKAEDAPIFGSWCLDWSK
jgi:hypothetical protein